VKKTIIGYTEISPAVRITLKRFLEKNPDHGRCGLLKAAPLLWRCMANQGDQSSCVWSKK
jgi:hypothetical protein